MKNKKFLLIYFSTRLVFLMIFIALVKSWRCPGLCEWFSIPDHLLFGYIILFPLDAVIASNMLRFRKVAGIIVFLLLTLIWEVAIFIGISDTARAYQIGISSCHYHAEKLVAECTYPETFNSSCRQSHDLEGRSEKFRLSVEAQCKKAVAEKNPACIYDEQGKVTEFNVQTLESSPLLRGFKRRCAPAMLDPLWKQLYGETRSETLIPNSNPAKTPEELERRREKYHDREVSTWE